jgi:Domain of unknown function (DUF4259)
MGTWAAGNFDNDAALDHAQQVAEWLMDQVEATLASEHGMEPDERDSARMMAGIELLWLIGQHVRLSLPTAETVAYWRDEYLAVWDRHIDGLTPVPGFKEERRAVIVESFDRLIALCRSQEP